MPPFHQEKQVFLSMAPMVLFFYLVQATYVFLRRSLSRSVYFRSFAVLFSEMSPRGPVGSSAIGVTWSLFLKATWLPFGTQQDLSRFLLPMVSAECYKWRWSLRALTQDPGFPRYVPSFLPRLTLKTLRGSRWFEWFVRCLVDVCFFQVVPVTHRHHNPT